MRKRKKSDQLVWALESALDLGEFVSYNRSWDFVRDLEDVKHKIDALVKDGIGGRAPVFTGAGSEIPASAQDSTCGKYASSRMKPARSV